MVSHHAVFWLLTILSVILFSVAVALMVVNKNMCDYLEGNCGLPWSSIVCLCTAILNQTVVSIKYWKDHRAARAVKTSGTTTQPDDDIEVKPMTAYQPVPTTGDPRIYATPYSAHPQPLCQQPQVDPSPYHPPHYVYYQHRG